MNLSFDLKNKVLIVKDTYWTHILVIQEDSEIEIPLEAKTEMFLGFKLIAREINSRPDIPYPDPPPDPPTHNEPPE